MKSGWQTKPLGEVCAFRRGLTYSKGDEVAVSDNVVLRATNIDLSTNLLNLDELKYIKNTVVVPESKKVHKDSLIICTASGSKTHLGKVAYIDEDYGYAFGGFMGMLTPLVGVLPRYLFYLMISDEYKRFIGNLSDGANINNLKFDDLKEFQVPHPRPTEQQRIVALLDEAFVHVATATAAATTNIHNARALFESFLHDAIAEPSVEWPETELGDEVDLLAGFAFKSAEYTSADHSVRLLRGDNIVQGALRWDDVKRWPLSKTSDFARYQLEEGDVVLAMDRPWVKAGLKHAVITASDLPSLLVQRTARLRCGPTLDKRFLYYLVGSAAFTRHILGVQTGLGVPHISGQQIAAFAFRRPPLKEQRHIARILDGLWHETSQMATTQTDRLEALDRLKSSLLHDAFAGDL